MSEIERLAAAIKTISETYLTRMVASDNREGIQRWSLRLADYSTRLAILTGPALSMREMADLNPAEPPPNFGVRHERSASLYGTWATEWFQRTFPEAYRDYPIVHAVDQGTIADAAKRDGCLAQVCAAEILSSPTGPSADLGDWSLYTGLSSEAISGDQFAHRVYHMGALVGEKIGGPDDGLEYAHSLGFDW